MALEVSGIRQHQVGEGGHLRLESVADNQEGNFVFALFVAVIEHLAHLDGIHRRVPRHVGHEDQQGVDAVRIAAPGIGDHVVHHAVHRQRVFPGKRLVQSQRAAVGIEAQVIGPRRPAQRQPAQRRVGTHRLRPFRRLGHRRDRPRERRLVTKTAGPVDGAEQRHQNRQRTDGLKTIGMRSKAAHRMEGHRVAGDGFVFLAPGIGPGNRQFDFLVARGDAHFMREAAYAFGRDAGDALGPLRRVFLDPLQQ